MTHLPFWMINVTLFNVRTTLNPMLTWECSFAMSHHRNGSLPLSLVSPVYVFLGDSDALIDFVRAMRLKGLNEKGEYVVIAVEEKPFDPEAKLEYFKNCKSLYEPY